MRKSFFAVAAAGFLIAFYVLVVIPAEGKKDLVRERLYARYEKLQKYRHLMSGGETSRDVLDSERKELETLEKGLIKEHQEPIAFAAIQLRIQDQAAKAGLATTTIRPMKAEKEGYYTWLPISIEAEGSIKQVSDFMRSLDSAYSYMKIENLTISQKDLREEKQLKLRMQIAGLVKQ